MDVAAFTSGTIALTGRMQLLHNVNRNFVVQLAQLAWILQQMHGCHRCSLVNDNMTMRGIYLLK
jgi:hypothetical protein